MTVELKKFKFEHLDIFDWQDDDLKTYGAASEIMDALANAETRGECWTAVCDGRILVIGGIIPQTKKTGICFSLFSIHAEKHKVATARIFRRMFEGMVASLALHRVVTYNRADAGNQHEWCEWLGFELEAKIRKFDEQGGDYFQYAYIKD